MKNLYISTIISSLILSFTSCKKYEEGPTLSFRSKKERVANTWIISKAIEDGEDVTDDFEAYTVSFTEDGATTLVAQYTIFGGTYTFNTKGTWVFENDNEFLYINYDNDDADNTYKILKLKEKELWVKDEAENLELRLIPQ